MKLRSSARRELASSPRPEVPTGRGVPHTRAVVTDSWSLESLFLLERAGFIYSGCLWLWIFWTPQIKHCIAARAVAMALRSFARTLLQRHQSIATPALYQQQQGFVRSYAAAAHAEWDYRGQRQIVPVGHRVPIVAVDAFVAPNVVLAGAVDIQDRATVWYGSVLRGDLNRIVVGFSSSIGDKCVLHAASTAPTGLSAETLIGKYSTIGSYSTLRSCTVEDEAVVGQRCVLLEGSLVEQNSMLGSGSVLPPGRRVPAGELWAGNPARFVRTLTHDEILAIPGLAGGLRELAQEHAQEFLPYGTAYLELEKLWEKLKLPI